MKEPKFPKLEDIPKDHKYDFFAEGVFPDTEDEKQNKNLGSQKKSRLPFSLPANAIRKVSNTQKDDDLVPFFAKNYPSSSESKEEVCFINSPSPSDTPDNTGEAEEVDIDESEEDDNENKEKENKDKNKNEKGFNNNKKLILNNEDLGVSMDFNSEMENEYENPSKMMSKEEVQELKRKKKLEREEEERKKKEEEKKKEELKKKKEEELRKKSDEEKKKKEKEKEKEQKEKEKKENERLKKIEEEKKKKIKSNKKDPLNMLSSIKKNYDDNSNMASNSMINDVQNFFAIPEEKGENEDEDEDTTKKNFKKSIKESEQKSQSKNKSKKNPKSTTVEEDKDKDKQSKEEDINKNKKNKLSRKSNGLKVKDEEEKKKEKKDEIKSDSEKEEEYSNYGDQLADAESGEKNIEIDSDSPPKKQKVKESKEKKTQNRKKIKKINKDNTLSQIEIYQIQMGLNGVQKYSYDIVPNKETKTFGNGRYPVRNRVRALRHELGERAIYIFDEDGLPNLKCLDLARNSTLSDSINKSMEKLLKKRMKKKLVKGLSNNNNETIPEESNEYNSENLNSDNISEYGEDEARILKIPKGGKKSLAKNYDTVLMIKIIEAHGKNLIRVDKEEYKNLKNDNQVKVGKNQEFEILNFSENFLVVQLVFDENN